MEGVGTSQPLMPTANHLDNQTISYDTDPPTSGNHWSAPAQCAFYEEELADELIVHNMEHGHVIISHNLRDPAQVETLRQVVAGLPSESRWGITRPYSKIPEGTVAMSAWGVLDQFEGVNEERISAFFEAYAGNRFSDETRRLGRGIPCS